MILKQNFGSKVWHHIKHTLCHNKKELLNDLLLHLSNILLNIPNSKILILQSNDLMEENMF